jgi:CRP-like cAMP-binding protein
MVMARTATWLELFGIWMSIISTTSAVKCGEFGKIRTYSAGTELLRQAEPVEDVYLVHAGVIKLVWADKEANQTIIGLRWPGWFIGAAACIVGNPNPASAVTLVTSTLERTNADAFLHLIGSNSSFARKIQESHCREIIEQSRLLGELACVPAGRRFERFLIRLNESVGDQAYSKDGRLLVPLKRKEIAAILGITAEHLCRVLSALAEAGVLELEEQWIVVRDFMRLRNDAA